MSALNIGSVFPLNSDKISLHLIGDCVYGRLNLREAYAMPHEPETYLASGDARRDRFVHGLLIHAYDIAILVTHFPSANSIDNAEIIGDHEILPYRTKDPLDTLVGDVGRSLRDVTKPATIGGSRMIEPMPIVAACQLPAVVPTSISPAA